MHFFSRYFYIWKFGKAKEAAYEEYCRVSNLLSLYLINALVILGMSMFLVVDYYREVQYSIVFFIRLGYLIASLVTILIAWKVPLKPKLVNLLILLAMGSLSIFSMVLSYFGKMPSFFLTNVTVMILMGVSTICGLPFRYTTLFNIFSLVAFFIFSQRILPNPFYKSQYANILLMFIDSAIASVLLEIRRRKSFLQYEDVARQKNRIEELNEQKNKIISVLSHDVASPINSLTGLLRLHESGSVKEEEVKSFMQEIRKRLDGVSSLVFGLVRWSKSQLEGFVPEKRIIDIGSLANEISELFRPAASEKSVQINIQVSPDLFVNSDEEMIRIVIRNLLSNAVKFSLRNSNIELRAFRKNAAIKVSVMNKSTPIPETIVQKLFSYQISSSEGTAGEKGTGLGLAMASYFLKVNGGKIFFEGYDSSTQMITFAIEMPASTVTK